MTKLDSRLPETINGLDAIADLLIADPTARWWIVAWISTSKVAEDIDRHTKVPSVAVRAVEVVTQSDDLDLLHRIMTRATDIRLGATVLPFDQEVALQDALAGVADIETVVEEDIPEVCPVSGCGHAWHGWAPERTGVDEAPDTCGVNVADEDSGELLDWCHCVGAPAPESLASELRRAIGILLGNGEHLRFARTRRLLALAAELFDMAVVPEGDEDDCQDEEGCSS